MKITRYYHYVIVCLIILSALPAQGMRHLRLLAHKATSSQPLLKPRFKQLSSRALPSYPQQAMIRQAYKPNLSTQKAPRVLQKAPLYNQQSWVNSPFRFINKTSKNSTRKPTPTLLTAATLLLGATAATLMQSAAAQAEGDAEWLMPFTCENIKKHPECKKEFVPDAVKNITTTDKEIIKAINKLIEIYPESIDTLLPHTLKHFSEIDSSILQAIISKSHEQVADQYAKLALETENPHLKNIVERDPKILFAGNPLWSYVPEYLSERWFPSNSPTLQNRIILFIKNNPQILETMPDNNLITLHQGFTVIHQISVEKKLKETIVQRYLKPNFIAKLESGHQWLFSIFPEHAHDFMKIIIANPTILKKIDADNTAWLIDDFHSDKLIQALIKFDPEKLSDCSRPNAKNKIFAYVEKNPLELLENPQTGKLLNQTLNTNSNATQALIKAGLEHCSRLPVSNLNRLFEHMSPENRAQLELTIKEKLGNDLLNNDILSAILQHDIDIPLFVKCLPENHMPTQTEKHFCSNLDQVRYMLQNHSANLNHKTRSMLLNFLKKEREEAAKGNIIFAHGRKAQWGYLADIYKMAYNLDPSHSSHQVGDDYVFLRFTKDYKGDEGFCLNYALFGNAQDRTSSSASYAINNHDYSKQSPELSSEEFFKQFNLSSYYSKHKDKFDQLEKLHQQITGEHGSLLLISAPPKDLHHFYPARRGSMGKTKTCVQIDGECRNKMSSIIRKLKTKPQLFEDSDKAEFGIKVSQDYLLDPQKGPRIYNLYAANPSALENYNQKRDALFATIKAEIALGSK